MATASQSHPHPHLHSHSHPHRYIGPPSVVPGDALNRILADLCTRGNPKEGASLAFKKHLEEEARDLSGEAFSRFMDQLYDKISSLLESSDVAENLGALRAIDELIDVALGENGSKVSRFSSYMRTVFEAKRDPEILVHASRVLGHLARAGGAMTADEVERQVKIALDWLEGPRVEYRRFAAVLILKEMAENASTVFNVHVPEFVDAIWVPLRDPALPVRERAVEALRACLNVIEKRETRWRVQWYYRMFEATQDGLGKNAPVHSIHGSLLAVGELLRKMIVLKDIVPAAQNNIDTRFIILEKGKTALEGQNKVCLALVADETAAVHLQLWGDECDAFDSSDIIYLTNGIFSYQRGNLILRAGKRGKLEKIGEFTMSYVETPNMSEIHWVRDSLGSRFNKF